MENEAQPQGKIKSLLIVEDSIIILKRLTVVLHEALPGTEIMCVMKAADAINWMDKILPDVVILDLQLPDMNGIEVLKTIRHEHPNTRFIIFTNHTAPQIRSNCLKEGADGFYDKSTEFEKTIDHLLKIHHESGI